MGFKKININGENVEYVVIPSMVPNAMVFYHPQLDEHLIFVTSALQERLTTGELKAVLMHELGHVKYEHCETLIKKRMEWIQGMIKQVTAIPTKNKVKAIIQIATLVKRSMENAPKARQLCLEIEADNYAVNNEYGYDLLKALKKLRKSWFIKLSRDGSMELDERIDKLENRVRFNQHSRLSKQP